MQITFERTGGFAGMHLAMTLGNDDLDEQEVALIQDILAQSDFFALPSRIESPGGADRFIYRIDVRWHDQENTVEVGDAAAPEQLCPLIEHLEYLLRTRRRPA